VLDNNRVILTATGAKTYSTTYFYDSDNRLLTEVKTDSAPMDTTNYYYGSNGNQISKVTETLAHSMENGSITLAEGVARSELSRYNGFNRLAETNVGVYLCPIKVGGGQCM